MCIEFLPSPKSEAEVYFVQQHYRMPTRLLDWTTSPLAALYFAVESLSKEDGALFIMDAYSLGPDQAGKYKDDRPYVGIASSRSSLLADALRPIFRWEEPKWFPDFILPVRPDRSDLRISRQRGCFTFHPPGHHTLTTTEARSLKVYAIPSSSKDCIRSELALLGVDHFSIFGDLDHLAEYLKDVHKVT
jgi:hypothetical protein